MSLLTIDHATARRFAARARQRYKAHLPALLCIPASSAALWAKRSAAYNLVRVHETLGTTPAVVSGLATRPWTVGDLVSAALEEPETEAPRAVALAPRPGAGPARQTGTGRVLRLVHGGSARQAEPVPAAPAPEATAPEAPAGPMQLDLLS